MLVICAMGFCTIHAKTENNFDMHLYNNNLGYECDTDLKIKGSILQNEERIKNKMKSFLTKVRRGR